MYSNTLVKVKKDNNMQEFNYCHFMYSFLGEAFYNFQIKALKHEQLLVFFYWNSVPFTF